MASEQLYYTKRTFQFHLQLRNNKLNLRKQLFFGINNTTIPKNNNNQQEEQFLNISIPIQQQFHKQISSSIDNANNVFLSQYSNIRNNNHYTHNNRKWSKRKTKIQQQKEKYYLVVTRIRKASTKMSSCFAAPTKRKLFVVEIGRVEKKQRNYSNSIISKSKSIIFSGERNFSTNQISQPKSKWFQKHRWKIDGKYKFKSKNITININNIQAFYIESRKVIHNNIDKKRYFALRNSKKYYYYGKYKRSITKTTTGEKFSKILCEINKKQSTNKQIINNINNNGNISFKFFTHNSNIDDKQFSCNNKQISIDVHHSKYSSENEANDDDDAILCSNSSRKLCYKCDNEFFSNQIGEIKGDKKNRNFRSDDEVVSSGNMEIFKINNRSISKIFNANFDNCIQCNGTIKFYSKNFDKPYENCSSKSRCSSDGTASENCFKYDANAMSSLSPIVFKQRPLSNGFKSGSTRTILSTDRCSSENKTTPSLSLSNSTAVLRHFRGGTFKIFIQHLLPILLLFNILPFIKAGEFYMFLY